MSLRWIDSADFLVTDIGLLLAYTLRTDFQDLVSLMVSGPVFEVVVYMMFGFLTGSDCAPSASFNFSESELQPNENVRDTTHPSLFCPTTGNVYTSYLSCYLAVFEIMLPTFTDVL